jgi:cyclopropane fatty-acyl-phospholipid synthase-like methyltransferase
MDWRRHWQEYPEGFGENMFLEQVGKTVNGLPISDEEFETIVHNIIATLDLDANDSVLDLCCGNGLITRVLSEHCKAISGVDFSQRLIEVARKYNAAANISYHCGSILDPDVLPSLASFNKAYMYEALQHFRRKDLPEILSKIFSPDSSIELLMLGSVPELALRWRFYNTFTRKLNWLTRTLHGREAIGTWWSRRNILEACTWAGVRAEFMDQPHGLYTAHYRMNVLIKRG